MDKFWCFNCQIFFIKRFKQQNWFLSIFYIARSIHYAFATSDVKKTFVIYYRKNKAFQRTCRAEYLHCQGQNFRIMPYPEIVFKIFLRTFFSPSKNMFSCGWQTLRGHNRWLRVDKRGDFRGHFCPREVLFLGDFSWTFFGDFSWTFNSND